MFTLPPKELKALVTAGTINKDSDPEFLFRATPQMCQKIIEWSQKTASEKGETIRDKNASSTKRNDREVTQYPIPINQETAWLYQRLLGVVQKTNRETGWDFDISGFHFPLLLLHYDGQQEHHYDWHLDLVSGKESGRKISLSLQLSNSSDYEGGDLELMTSSQVKTAGREQGDIILFPSYVLHRVTPVTKGDRWCVVGWIHGQQHFR